MQVGMSGIWNQGCVSRENPFNPSFSVPAAGQLLSFLSLQTGSVHKTEVMATDSFQVLF